MTDPKKMPENLSEFLKSLLTQPGVEDPTPQVERKETPHSYFMFYIINGPDGPTLGSTVLATNTPINAHNFGKMRKSLVDDAAEKLGITGITVDDLTIITISKLV